MINEIHLSQIQSNKDGAQWNEVRLQKITGICPFEEFEGWHSGPLVARQTILLSLSTIAFQCIDKMYRKVSTTQSY